MALSLTVEKNTYHFSGKSYQPTKEKNELLRAYGKMIHNYGLVLQLLPEPSVEEKLNQQIGNARWVANRYLSDRMEQYNQEKTTLSVNNYKKMVLPTLKEEFSFLKKSDKFALESALEHVEDAYQHFFKHQRGFPKYKSKYKPNGNSYTTKFTNNNIELLLGKTDRLPYIKLPKIGKIRFVMPKKQTMESLLPVHTKILSATIKHTGKHYTVSLALETIVSLVKEVHEVSRSRILGIDLGLKVFGVLGNESISEEIPNPRWINRHEKRLRRFQQSLSRKQYNRVTHKGSKNWQKAKERIQKEHRKCANQRKDFHHKLSRKIADRCDVFICEDLNIKGMMKNRHLSKSIASVGWYQFLTFTEYKLKKNGGRMVKISRWIPSSQTCSVCGTKNSSVKDLSVRAWTCPVCGTYHDRDINAKTMIVQEGIKQLEREGYTIYA